MPAFLSTPFRREYVLRDRNLESLGAATTQVAVAIGNGFVSINVDDLRPGDVLLFSRGSKSAVATYQRLIFTEPRALWTHCGVLDESFSVWDAMPSKDVRVRPLREVLREKHDLAVVRPSRAIDPIRLRIALLQFSNHHYRVFRIQTGGRLAARLLGTGYNGHIQASDDATICSLFVVDVLRRASLYGYLKHVPIALPADFLGDPDFHGIDLTWVDVRV